MTDETPEIDEVLSELPDTGDPGECPDDGRLVALRDGELEPAERSALEAHLVGCARCRFLLRAMSEPSGEDEIHRARAAVTAAPPRSRGRVIAFATAVAGAAAAAAAFFALIPPDPPAYQLRGPYGAVERTRGDEAGDLGYYVPTSQIELLVERRGAAPAGEAPAVVAYTDGGDQRLHRTSPVRVERLRPGLIRVEVTAADVLGSRYGRRRLVLAVTEPGASLPPAVEGLHQLRHRDGVWWVDSVPIDYRAPSDLREERDD